MCPDAPNKINSILRVKKNRKIEKSSFDVNFTIWRISFTVLRIRSKDG